METLAPEFGPYFANLAAGRLCFPHCRDCARWHWYPMPLCPHCQSSQVAWRQVAGTAKLFSWTEIHHPFDARYAGPLPYVVGLVSFADAPGVRLVTHIVDAPAATLVIDMHVEPRFALGPDGTPQIVFHKR